MKDPRTPPPPPPAPSAGSLSLAAIAGLRAGLDHAPPTVPAEFAALAAEWHKGWLDGSTRHQQKSIRRPIFGNLRINYNWRK